MLTKSNFEEEVSRKKEKYAELADKKREMSSRLMNESNEMISMIPPGQPILVGHHSEKRHRNHLEKTNNKIRKSVDLESTAGYYAQKSESYMSNGKISSYDPQAIQKIEMEIEKKVQRIELMKAENKKAKKDGKVAPHELYTFGNLNARIRSMKKRLKILKAYESRPDEVIEIELGKVLILPSENRVNIHFDSIPSPEMRRKLKFFGFRWAPSAKVWTRRYSNDSVLNAKILFEI